MRRPGLFDPPAPELHLGDIRVRVRRNPGAGVPPCLWDVMDGARVAATFASVPSRADAEDAIRRFREGATGAAAVDAAARRALAREERTAAQRTTRRTDPSLPTRSRGRPTRSQR